MHRATPLAQRLRRAATPAEQRLWRELRGGALGVKFRRSHPIGRYVADFACVERKLVVEVDGGVHAMRTVEDQLRTEALEVMGWGVLRVTNEAVTGDMGGVLALITDTLKTPAETRLHL